MERQKDAAQIENGKPYRFSGSSSSRELLGIPTGPVIPVERCAGSGDWFRCRLADDSFLSIHYSDLQCAS